MKTEILKNIFSLYILFACLGCKKFTEVTSPPNRIDEGNVYNDNATATSVLTGVYTQMSAVSTSSTSGFLTLTKLAGLSSDEFALWSGASDLLKAYYENSLYANAQASPGSELWGTLYLPIFTCNAAIEGLSKSNKLDIAIKQQLTGEAKFLRALFYFYLVNLYGDIPLVTSTDYELNRLLTKTDKLDVYKFIIEELKEAKNYLSPVFVDGKLNAYISNPERVRPTTWAAASLLARAYLYNGEFVNAETEATYVLNQNSLFKLSSLDSVFLKNSSEAIWQLQPVIPNLNTVDGSQFVLTAAPVGFSTNKPIYLNSNFVSTIDSNDKRKSKWVGTYSIGSVKYYFPNKYKVATTGSSLTEYSMVIRLAELYLIRAEAKAQQGKLNDAKIDLNIIRARSGLVGSIASTKDEILSDIFKERRVEFFAELGHRWLDLKRTNAVDIIMGAATPLKGGKWESYKKLYPLPFTEINNAPNVSQNFGYN